MDKTGGGVDCRTGPRPSIPKQDAPSGNDSHHDQDDRHYRYDPDDRYDRHLHYVDFDRHFINVDKHLHFDQHLHKHFDHANKHPHDNGAGLLDSHSRTVVCRRKAGLLLMSHGAQGEAGEQRHSFPGRKNCSAAEPFF
jgi:hypothetical protein